MKKIFFVFTLAMAAFHVASAQSAQSVYFEVGGPGGQVSFNYDTRFSGREGGIGGRIGIGSTIEGTQVVFLPVGINYLFGKNTRHYFELGAGVTPVFGADNDDDSVLAETFGTLVIGYRFQPTNGGLTFRAFLCPIYGNGIFIPYFAGLSGGFKF